jgi:chemotaxis protein histidine kinase CheA
LTDSRNIKVKNRLGELMRQPGGRSAIEALRGAEKRLDKISDDLLRGLDRCIARMETAAGQLTDPPDDKPVTEIYRASNDMIAFAGLVGFNSLDEVAHGLCELIDTFRAENQWSDQAIRVHIDAVQLLRGLSKDDNEARERVLDGLRKVWSLFSVRQPLPTPEAAG